MSTTANGRGNGRVRSLEERADLVGRLRARSAEVEEAIFARIHDAVPDAAAGGDAEYVVGLRAAVAAVVDYGLTGIEHGEECAGPTPSVAVVQARRAARSGVGLETVLLRYAAGHRLMCDFVIAQADHFPGLGLRQVLDTQGLLFERLIASVSTEYRREMNRMGSSLEGHRAERVRRLLAGELPDTTELGYDFDAWHLGVIATGARAREVLRGLMAGFDRQLLTVSHGEETVWAWFGWQRKPVAADIERQLSDERDAGVSLAVGEPGRGIEGWRLTHNQAQAALLVALHRPRRLTIYADDMLLAAALRDQTLARSLREIYLAPLASQRDGGAVSRETLRAYFAAGRNSATAAHRLKVDRHTIERRVRTIEKQLGRMLHTCQAELEVALRMEELDDAGGPALPVPSTH
jgi:hypothetical protein